MTVRLTSPVLGLHLNDLYTGPQEQSLIDGGFAVSTDLGPVTATVTANVRNRVPFTGLAYGEYGVSVTPSDGRLGPEGRSLVTSATTNTNYSVVTSLGRLVQVAVTVSGGGTPTLGTPVLNGTLTAGVAASGVTVSGLTDGSAVTFSTAGISVGTTGNTRTVSGTPNAAGAVSLTETLAGAIGSPKTTPIGTVASVAGRASSFAFTDRGMIYDTPASMTNTATGLYYPTAPLALPTTGIWANSQAKWVSYASTDHDTQAGGIWMWVSNLTDPTDPAGWKLLQDAYDAGWMPGFTARPSSPIVVTYSDQTETPQVNLIGSKYVMTMQISKAGAAKLTPAYTRNQVTVRATSNDGYTWTKDAGPLLTLTEDQCIGDGHTGYFRWGVNPFVVGPAAGYAYVGYSLSGATDQTSQAMWGSNEPVAGAWTFLAAVMRQSGRIDPTNDAAMGFAGMDVNSIRPVGDGTFSALVGVSADGSGASSSGTKYGQMAEIRLDPTGLSTLAKPTVVIPRGSNARAQFSNGLLGLTKIGSNFAGIYYGKTEGQKAAACATTSPVLDPKDTTYAAVTPAAPASLTTRSADFRSISTLPSFLTATDYGTGQAAPTFDSNGLMLSITSAATAGRYGLYGEEIPSGVSFVDFLLEDVRCTGGTAYRGLNLGLTSAVAGAPITISMDSLIYRAGAGGTGSGGAATSPSGSTANVVGIPQRAFYKDTVATSSVSGQDTRTFGFSEKHPGFGYATEAPTRRINIGLRWFLATDQLFTLAEQKAIGGIEIEPHYIDPEYRNGGARRANRPIRPFFAMLGISNQACVQRVGAFKYRFG